MVTLVEPLVTNIVVNLTKMTSMSVARHGPWEGQVAGHGLMVRWFCTAASRILAFEQHFHVKGQAQESCASTLEYRSEDGDYNVAHRASTHLRDFWATKCPPYMQKACKDSLDAATRLTGVTSMGKNSDHHLSQMNTSLDEVTSKTVAETTQGAHSNFPSYLSSLAEGFADQTRGFAATQMSDQECYILEYPEPVDVVALTARLEAVYDHFQAQKDMLRLSRWREGSPYWNTRSGWNRSTRL